MARVPSSRYAVHCRLRIPDLREGDDSPLGSWSRHAALATCRSRKSPIQTIRPHGQSGISQTPSQLCAYDWARRSREACHDALVAKPGFITAVPRRSAVAGTPPSSAGELRPMILEGKLASGPTPSERLRYDSLQFGADRVGKRRKAQSRDLRGPDPIEW